MIDAGMLLLTLDLIYLGSLKQPIFKRKVFYFYANAHKV